MNRRKPKMTRKQRKLIFISTEGKNKTEENYFSQFNRVQKEYHINFAKGDDTDAKRMTVALEKAMQEGGYNSESGDLAFCVIDVDNDEGKSGSINGLKGDGANRDIIYITSNPCFEYWFLLHFTYTTKQFMSGKELEKELRKHLPEYRKNKGIFEKVYPHTRVALENSKKSDRFHEKSSLVDRNLFNPSTNVSEIIRLLWKE